MGNLRKVILVLALASAAGIGVWMFSKQKKPVQETFEPPTSKFIFDENSYQRVFERTVNALRVNNPGNIYKDLSPSLRDLFTYESFLKGYKTQEEADGKIVKVEIISSPQLKSGGEWEENKWADGKIKVIRARSSKLFFIRMVKEDEGWWSYGTIEMVNAN